MIGDQQDGIFLQAGLAQGWIGLIKLVYAHTIGFGNTKEGLPFQHHVGKVNFVVQFYFFLGKGDGGGDIFLRNGSGATHKQERSEECKESFHDNSLHIISWRQNWSVHRRSDAS